MGKTDYCIVITTTDSQEKAERLASMIVEAKLGGCVQIIPIKSFYFWNGNINNDSEFRLEIKTSAILYTELEKFILKNHTYSTPEIIMIPISHGSSNYIKWLDDYLAK